MKRRRIKINNKYIEFDIGHRFTKIWYTDGTIEIVEHNVMLGISWDAIERARHKKSEYGIVMPSHIRRWVENKCV